MQWLSTQQAADQLGVAPNTIRRYITDRALPYSDIGVTGKPRIRIAKEDLDAWVKSQQSAA